MKTAKTAMKRAKPAAKQARGSLRMAKLFTNGKSQAVRLPKDFRLPGTEVCIQKIGHVIMLFPKERAWDIFEESLNEFTDDFLAEGRDQGEQSPREPL